MQEEAVSLELSRESVVEWDEGNEDMSLRRGRIVQTHRRSKVVFNTTEWSVFMYSLTKIVSELKMWPQVGNLSIDVVVMKDFVLGPEAPLHLSLGSLFSWFSLLVNNVVAGEGRSCCVRHHGSKQQLIQEAVSPELAKKIKYRMRRR